MKVPVETRFWAKVNKTPGCWEWTGAKTTEAYGQLNMSGKQNGLAHRFSFELSKGPIPEGMLIDHICMNRGCVNPEHLRLATRKQNAEHRAGAQSNNNSSGVRGVHRALNGKWHGKVMHNKKAHYTFSFDTIAEAEAAVTAIRNELFTHNDGDRAA